jgi:DNA modification methylase
MKKAKPIKRSIVAKGHTPQYRMHKYFARRPYNVFSNLIQHYTNKNDIVLDCFCGGGVTIFEAAALGRKSIGVDINPLATFITRMQMFNGDLELVKAKYNQFIKQIKNKYSDWYYVKFDDDEGICEWVEWVYIVSCPHCNAQIPLTEDYKLKNGIFKCPNPKCKGKDGVRRVDCIPNCSKPLRARYSSKKTKQVLIREITSVEQICNLPDFEAIIRGFEIKPDFEFPLDWDRQHEDKLKERGIIKYRHLFTDRNYAINCCIFNDILAIKESLSLEIYELLYFLFSSSLRYTNSMTRVTENWEGGKPTAMDKHAFWLPNQYIETNVVDIIEKRAKAVLQGLAYSKSALPATCKEVKNIEDLKNSGEYIVLNRSSSNLPLADESVDVIITDPPYGSNVQYAELSTVWNAWFDLFNGLNGYIFKDEEAIVNRKLKVKGSKTENDYERLLFGIYAESSRVLKDGGYLVFTFNNKNIKVWIAMMKAVARAGFYLPEDGVLFQDFIESYKNTTHLRYSGNIHGDFIYSFVKGDNPVKTILNGYNLQEAIRITIENEISRLFNIRKKYTTTELYQKIFSKLVSILLAYIVKYLENEKEMLLIEEYSNDYIDNILHKYLDYKNDKWCIKEQTNGTPSKRATDLL